MDETDQLLEVKREGDRIVISIGVNTVVNAVQMGPSWPVDRYGDPEQILDEEQFIKELIGELLHEEEDGSTDIHAALDKAAIRLIENGSDTVSMEWEEISARDRHFF
jgi:hypothetical protein